MLLAVCAVAACASTSSRTAPRQRNLITVDEIDATTLYGIGHGAGAIQVVTRRG
jgi:hypothetical protein